MKKHYEKMCMTPLGFEPLGNLLAASTANQTTVRTTGQEVQSLDFSDDTFNHEWGD